MRLTKYEPSDESMFPYRLKDEELSTELDSIHKLGQLEDIEDELGFGLNELVQMLINGVWKVCAVDSETMLPVSQGITHFYIYGIDFENKKIKVFHKIFDWERDTNVSKDVLFSVLDLDKYKKKSLSGWALTKEELE